MHQTKAAQRLDSGARKADPRGPNVVKFAIRAWFGYNYLVCSTRSRSGSTRSILSGSTCPSATTR